MYGLVNRAVKELVTNNFGEEQWLEILSLADISDDNFISMEAYDDDITYQLVGAATKVLGIEADLILQTFGEYWMTYTAEQGYGPLLEIAGSDFGTFLTNLNTLHQNVAMSFPKLTPPHFEVEEKADNQWLLYYFSERKGLAPMMLGLLKGLGKRFNMPLTIEFEDYNKAGTQCVRFDISTTSNQ